MYVLHPHKYIIVADLGNKQKYGACEKNQKREKYCREVNTNWRDVRL